MSGQFQLSLPEPSCQNPNDPASEVNSRPTACPCKCMKRPCRVFSIAGSSLPQLVPEVALLSLHIPQRPGDKAPGNKASHSFQKRLLYFVPVPAESLSSGSFSELYTLSSRNVSASRAVLGEEGSVKRIVCCVLSHNAFCTRSTTSK